MISNINKASDKEFIHIVKNSKNMAAIARKLGYASVHTNITSQIEERMKSLNLSDSHFCKNLRVILTDEEIFSSNSSASQSTLRKRFKELGHVEYKCSICGQEPMWMGKELTLTLDHIDGNNTNDVVENLRWVCPNCDRQLDTFGSKNIRKRKRQLAPNPEAIKSNLSGNRCEICGKPISADAMHCVTCCKIESRVAIRPKREELKTLLRENTMSDIGKQFNVSDNAIRKWCTYYNLPRKIGQIRRMTNEEWAVI